MKPLASELKRPPPSADAAPPARLVPPLSGMSASGASDHGLNGVLSVFCCVPVPDDIPDVVPDDEPDDVPAVVEKACAAGSTMPNCGRQRLQRNAAALGLDRKLLRRPPILRGQRGVGGADAGLLVRSSRAWSRFDSSPAVCPPAP